MRATLAPRTRGSRQRMRKDFWSIAGRKDDLPVPCSSRQAERNAVDGRHAAPGSGAEGPWGEGT